MASTVSHIIDPYPVFGNYRVACVRYTLSGTADTTKCGLKWVNFCIVTPATVTSGIHNQITSTGSVQIFSGTTGDICNILAFGR